RRAGFSKSGNSSAVLAVSTLIAVTSSMPLIRSRTRRTTRAGGRVCESEAPRTATSCFFIPGHETDRPEGAAGEGVTVDADGNVYGAEVTVRGLTKYVKNSTSR